jgi:hypothetical protein
MPELVLLHVHFKNLEALVAAGMPRRRGRQGLFNSRRVCGHISCTFPSHQTMPEMHEFRLAVLIFQSPRFLPKTYP